MKKYIIGVPSYFPDSTWESRCIEFEKFLHRVEGLFPGFPILIIAQNWKDYTPEHLSPMIIIRCEKLGIVKARLRLQKELIKQDFDYALLFDDDAVIFGNDVQGFLEPFERFENGFCFRDEHPKEHNWNRYMAAALNFCVISKYILSREFINIDLDPQAGIGYEDVIYPCMLHNKYRDKEIKYPVGTLFTSFKTIFGKIPSTWYSDFTREKSGDSWGILWENTVRVCDYIEKHKKYPEINIDEHGVLII